MEDDKSIDQEMEEIQRPNYGPLKIIGALFLILILVLWIIPSYAIKTDLFPQKIVSIKEVIPTFPDGNEFGNENYPSIKSDYTKLMIPRNPYVKYTSDKIISLSNCENSKPCYAKAIYYFVRDNFDYVSDPLAFEYVKGPLNSMQTSNGDCDDASVLLANLLQAIGINTRFVFMPGHVFVQAEIPEAKGKYKTEKDWVSLDATCKACEFGEIPLSSYGKDFSYYP